ncbi:hypothetical protein NEOLI_001627 [Neolecta irregularis DAH-3]|uniref:Uncharacterized protein n=1 Tax=Neolecta irregularis (strain DAH-3) TaxID=1198029 RepID=A0A1U7LSJ8_NEOID|nr:hypothetical protein NEOLI_001627 [Neolecta irregularis DAH-3]|eukprot:OLL25645.1 hypothetical protein NEOLI_001627 [Neolecta irregularis DAH-3]
MKSFVIFSLAFHAAALPVNKQTSDIYASSTSKTTLQLNRMQNLGLEIRTKASMKFTSSARGIEFKGGAKSNIEGTVVPVDASVQILAETKAHFGKTSRNPLARIDKHRTKEPEMSLVSVAKSKAATEIKNGRVTAIDTEAHTNIRAKEKLQSPEIQTDADSKVSVDLAQHSFALPDRSETKGKEESMVMIKTSASASLQMEGGSIKTDVESVAKFKADNLDPTSTINRTGL